MTEYMLRIDLPTEPPAVAMDGRTVTLSRRVSHFENTGLWGAEQLTFQDDESHDTAYYSERFDEYWSRCMAEVLSDSMNQGEGTGATLTDMYDHMLSMQEQQAVTDAALCDLYEALAGGE